MSLSRVKISSIILAGGKGTRLFPLTLYRCKPGVVFGGCYRLIDVPISNSYQAGIRDIHILTQHLSTSIHNHVMNTYPLDFEGEECIHLLSGDETAKNGKFTYLGTADAVRKNLDNFPAERDYYFILSGDQLYSMDLGKVFKFATEKDADLVVCSLKVNKTDARRMGILKINDDHQITAFYEKPKEDVLLNSLCLANDNDGYLGSMGIYLFKKAYLEKILKNEGDDFGKEIIPLAVQQKRAYAYIFNGYWEDIGTVEAFFKAHLALMKKGKGIGLFPEIKANHPVKKKRYKSKNTDIEVVQSLIAEGCHIEAKRIERSVIGFGVSIGQETIIEDSIILGSYIQDLKRDLYPVVIGEGCILKKCILDEGVCLPSSVQLINKDQKEQFDGDGIFIRDGVIVVTEKARISEGFIL